MAPQMRSRQMQEQMLNQPMLGQMTPPPPVRTQLPLVPQLPMSSGSMMTRVPDTPNGFSLNNSRLLQSNQPMPERHQGMPHMQGQLPLMGQGPQQPLAMQGQQSMPMHSQQSPGPMPDVASEGPGPQAIPAQMAVPVNGVLQWLQGWIVPAQPNVSL